MGGYIYTQSPKKKYTPTSSPHAFTRPPPPPAVPAGAVCTLYALCTYIQPVEHGRFTIPVEHDSGTRINTRTPHYVLLLQVQVSGFWMLDS